jgi:hypothetical protein
VLFADFNSRSEGTEMNELHEGLRLYRSQLRDAVAHDLSRSRAPRLALRIGAPALAAGAVTVAAFLLLQSGPQAPTADAAILHRVAAALTGGSGTILHERALVTLAGREPQPYELWQQVDSPYAYRVIKFGHEGGWDGSGYADFDRGANTIVVQPGSSTRSGPDDVAALLRSLVESGNAKIDEETTLGGVPAYKLTVDGSSTHFLNGTVYVARSDYRPLRVQTTVTGPRGDEVSETVEYQTYEYLPGTAANRSLVDLSAQHPGATMVGAPGGSYTTTITK